MQSQNHISVKDRPRRLFQVLCPLFGTRRPCAQYDNGQTRVSTVIGCIIVTMNSKVNISVETICYRYDFYPGPSLSRLLQG